MNRPVPIWYERRCVMVVCSESGPRGPAVEIKAWTRGGSIVPACKTRSHQERGHHEIECEHDDRGEHHGPGGRVGDAFAGRRGGVALEHRDQRDHGAECDALPDAVDDVLPDIDARGHVRPERAVVESEPRYAEI